MPARSRRRGMVIALLHGYYRRALSQRTGYYRHAGVIKSHTAV
ncbi:hypothetical protein ACWEV3_01510 [Saccharopolyspora sp. NPDC003752]